MVKVKNYVRIGVAVSSFLLLGALLPFSNIVGGGGSELFPPATIRTGEPTDIKIVVTATGGGGPIKGRYTNLAFHYKLEGEASYHTVKAHPTTLPDNFKAVQSKSFQSEAYLFTIAPYPKGTEGTMHYFTEITFDGYVQTSEAKKPIAVSDTAKSSYDLTHNLSPLAVCGQIYKADIITLEGMKITERIVELIEQEHKANGSADNASVCHTIRKLPANAVLRSSISDYDTKKLQYKVMLELPFMIDLVANKIYRLEGDNHVGKVIGRLH